MRTSTCVACRWLHAGGVEASGRCLWLDSHLSPPRCPPSQALASLRRRLNRAFNTFERAKFEFVQSVILAIDVHDIAVCRDAGRTNGDRKFKSSLRPPRTGPRADMKDRLEYYWKVR